MRHSLHLALADLGQLSFAGTVPYLLGGLLADRLVGRISLRLTLVTTTTAALIALVGWSLAPFWIEILASVGLLGLVKGVLDAAVNAEAALESGMRRLGLLHASWAIGGTLGPVIVATLVAGRDWRPAVAVVAVATGFLVPFAAFIRRQELPVPALEGPPRDRAEKASNRRAVLATALAFSAYTAAETGPVSWGATYLTADRRLSVVAAAGAMAVFWAALTLGRLGLALPQRLRGQQLLEVSCLVFVVGTGLIWVLPGPYAVIGLGLSGLGAAPVFPLYVALTPERFGAELTGRAVGYAIAGAAAGAPVAVYLFGELAAHFGTAVLAPCIFGAGVLMYLGHRLLVLTAGEGPPLSREGLGAV
jgi:fucose permease